jgi:hypothetical protein
VRRRSDPALPQLDGGALLPGDDGYQLITGTYDVFWTGEDDHQRAQTPHHERAEQLVHRRPA